MIASLSHAVDRTLATFDQLGVMWGPEVTPNLSVHGLTHEQVHQIQHEGGVENGASSEWTSSPYVESTVRTPMGWAVMFFASADLTCDRCRELCGLAACEAVEAAPLGGVVERMEGAGL